jgi:hypothetical protein
MCVFVCVRERVCVCEPRVCVSERERKRGRGVECRPERSQSPATFTFGHLR